MRCKMTKLDKENKVVNRKKNKRTVVSPTDVGKVMESVISRWIDEEVRKEGVR